MGEIIKNKDYIAWVNTLKERYISNQTKAFTAVNSFLLEFYYSIGRDISLSSYANQYGSSFYETLSSDLKKELPDVRGFSATNLKYMFYFYELYYPYFANRPQPVDDFTEQQLFQIPWGHHRCIIDKCKGNVEAAIFYVKQTLMNNWSRNMLLNNISLDFFASQGKAISNFKDILPEPQGDLAQEITKDPYKFDFLMLRNVYDERELKDALLENVTKFLMELGSGFSFMGREFRVTVGEDDYYIDLSLDKRKSRTTLQL